MVHPNDYCIWNAVSKQTLKFLNILLATCRYLMVSGTNPRELRGKLIASMKNAVKRISERTYRVSSQNGNGKYYDVRIMLGLSSLIPSISAPNFSSGNFNKLFLSFLNRSIYLFIDSFVELPTLQA